MTIQPFHGNSLNVTLQISNELRKKKNHSTFFCYTVRTMKFHDSYNLFEWPSLKQPQDIGLVDTIYLFLLGK